MSDKISKSISHTGYRLPPASRPNIENSSEIGGVIMEWITLRILSPSVDLLISMAFHQLFSVIFLISTVVFINGNFFLGHGDFKPVTSKLPLIKGFW